MKPKIYFAGRSARTTGAVVSTRSRSGISTAIKRGVATSSAVRFLADEVEDWIAARVAARVTKQASVEPASASPSDDTRD
jgi:hypothetical protein